MDITPYVERLRVELAEATTGGTPDVEEAVIRLARVLDPALRLTLFEVLADAAAEITSALPSGSVTARLAGRSVDFVVDGAGAHPGESGLPLPPAAPPAPGAPMVPVPMPPEPPEAGDEGDIARITVRLPEGIKEKAERQAGGSSQSLNSWIVNALREATKPGGMDIDLDLSHVPFMGREVPPGFPFAANFPFGGKSSGGSMKGWV